MQGGAVSWQSRLQKTVALSTTEVEYMAVVEAGKEVLWMKDFIGELGIRQEEYRLYCDSKTAIHLAKNAAYHSRTKHIQWRYHWIRERVEDRIGKTFHAGVKGEFVGKSVPPAGTGCKVQRTGSSQNRPPIGTEPIGMTEM